LRNLFNLEEPVNNHFMKNAFRLLSILLLAVGVFYSYRLFWPITYGESSPGSHQHSRKWHLATGSTIAYTLLAGNDQKKKDVPIIYLHGGPGAGITDEEVNTYRQIAAEGHDIYLYDQVGCGQSERLENIREYTVRRHAADLDAIISQIGSPEVILAGQSWGSILAVTYTAQHTRRVNKLVITAPAPLQPADNSLLMVKSPDSLQLRSPPFQYAKQKRRLHPLRMRVNLSLARKFGIKMVPDREADQFATWQTDELNLSMVCDTANAVKAESTEGYYVQVMTSSSIAKMQDLRPILRTVNIPVLVMKAQCDNQPWGYTAEYLNVFQNARLLTIRGAGHNAFIERSSEYVNAIIDFISN
jgi:proline iminopeptidase